MSLPDAISFINSVGLPGSLLVFGCYAVWRWGWWLLTEVIQPVGKRAIKFMEDLTVHGTELKEFTRQLCATQEQIASKQLEHDEHFAQLQRALQANGHDLRG